MALNCQTIDRKQRHRFQNYSLWSKELNIDSSEIIRQFFLLVLPDTVKKKKKIIVKRIKTKQNTRTDSKYAIKFKLISFKLSLTWSLKHNTLNHLSQTLKANSWDDIALKTSGRLNVHIPWVPKVYLHSWDCSTDITVLALLHNNL